MKRNFKIIQGKVVNTETMTKYSMDIACKMLEVALNDVDRLEDERDNLKDEVCILEEYKWKYEELCK